MQVAGGIADEAVVDLNEERASGFVWHAEAGGDGIAGHGKALADERRAGVAHAAGEIVIEEARRFRVAEWHVDAEARIEQAGEAGVFLRRPGGVEVAAELFARHVIAPGIRRRA